MATITPVTPTKAGVAAVFIAANVGGDIVAAGTSKDVTVLVRNAGGASITLTLAGKVACSQGSQHAETATCAVGDTEVLVPGHCIDAANGHIDLTYSAVTSVSVAAIAR